MVLLPLKSELAADLEVGCGVARQERMFVTKIEPAVNHVAGIGSNFHLWANPPGNAWTDANFKIVQNGPIQAGV